MDDEKKKRLAKEAGKAAGVAGAGAIIGAAALPTDALGDPLRSIANSGTPIGDLLGSNLMSGWTRHWHTSIMDRDPNVGMGVNAAASGLGALAAYGLLKSMKKAKEEKFNRKLELARAKNSHTINVDRS